MKTIDSVVEVEQINTFLNDIPGRIITFLVVNKDFEYTMYEIRTFILGGANPEGFAKVIVSIAKLVRMGIILKNEKTNKYMVNKQDPVILACLDLNDALRKKLVSNVYEVKDESSEINLNLETIEAINRFITQKKTCLDDNRAFVLMTMLYGMGREYVTDKNIKDVLKALKDHDIFLTTGSSNSWIQKLVKDGYIKMTFNFDLDKTVYAPTEEGKQFFDKYKLGDTLCLN